MAVGFQPTAAAIEVNATRDGGGVPEAAVERDQVGRAVGIIGLASIALIHLIDSVAKFSETRYIFVLYVVLMFGTLVTAAVLLRWDSRRAWSLVAFVTACTLIAFVISRTVGLPQSSRDVGNWVEPLGLTSMYVEGLVLLLSIYKLVTTRPGRA